MSAWWNAAYESAYGDTSAQERASEERRADDAYQDWLESLTDAEAEERQARGDVFAAQIRVALGWIDLEVRA